jgi:TnpA family transposase
MSSFNPFKESTPT